MIKQTIQQWLEHFIAKYLTKEDFKKDLNRMIEDLKEDKTSPAQLAFYKRVRNKLNKIETRLEELRAEINAERISTGEIIELQSLVPFINKDDVQLLEWAGVEENVIDLFEHYETLPEEVQAVLEKYGEVETYQQCADMLKEVEALGYTFDYYLDACPYNLRKINLVD